MEPRTALSPWSLAQHEYRLQVYRGRTVDRLRYSELPVLRPCSAAAAAASNMRQSPVAAAGRSSGGGTGGSAGSGCSSGGAGSGDGSGWRGGGNSGCGRGAVASCACVHVPLLSEVLNEFPGVPIQIDVKSDTPGV
eukprot:366425-Chlamydomonas_euryale.AAC.6